MKYITARNRTALKIKAKHLAAEAKIIRKEEKNWRGDDRAFFRDHRVTTVRNEARATHLAVAFLRGVPYNVLEQKCHDVHIRREVSKRMQAMITRYCNYELRELTNHCPTLPDESTREERVAANAEWRKTALPNMINDWFEGK